VLVDNPAPAPEVVPPAAQPDSEEEPDDGQTVEAPSLVERDVSGIAANKTPAIAWGLLAALVWLVTWLLSKRWGRVTAYAMGTPVFFVVLFVFFENFARLLPANI
jgi:drug/metabolite transporter (DMT)-like permease